jgi:secondary thiamine-phosphate synthase enzyme
MVKQLTIETAGPGLREITREVQSPEGDALYTHDAEGPDDMPAHIKAALTATSLSIPVLGKKLVLGTWQGIYLWEHRRRGGRREVVLHITA